MITQTQTRLSLAEAVAIAQDKHLLSKVSRSSWRSIRASGIDDPCARRIYYYRTCGELDDSFGPDKIALFEEGRDQEPVVRRYLSELGFEVKKAGITEYWEKFGISGQIDGVISYDGQDYLVEIKTLGDAAWESIKTIEDLRDGGKWFRKWYGQMQIYLLLCGYEKGFFVFKKKTAKLIRLLEITLDYDYAEQLLKRAEVVNIALEKSEPPDFLANNPIECRRCPFFGKVCNPPMDYGQTVPVVEDSDLERKLERREILKAAFKEYEQLDKDVKGDFREIPKAVCGDFVITGSKQIRSIAAKPASTQEVWITKIERLTEDR